MIPSAACGFAVSSTKRKVALRVFQAIDQHGNLAGDGLGPADVADLLACLRLDVDSADLNSEQVGHRTADRSLDRAELRLLGEDDHIEIDNRPAIAVQPSEGFPKEQARVGIVP